MLKNNPKPKAPLWGKQKTYFIQTFGCAMNFSDSERFAGIVEDMGYKQTENWKNADLVVINSCSIRQKAEDRIVGLGEHVLKIKEKNPDFKIILSGCMARRKWDEKKLQSRFDKSSENREAELKKQMPWLDFIIETKDFASLPEKLGYKIDYTNVNPEDYLSFKPKYKSNFQAFIPISTGCNHFCTYCIVPYARGKEICRSAESIIAETFNLVKKGYKDITLLGQTVNRWNSPKIQNPKIKIQKNDVFASDSEANPMNKHPVDNEQLAKWKSFFVDIKFEIDDVWIRSRGEQEGLKMPVDFLQLLQVIDQIDGEWWMSFMSSHPNYMTEELVKYIGKSSELVFWKDKKGGHIKPAIHFALQSGSGRMLKKMNRVHKLDEFLEIVVFLKKYIPDLSLSTDFIVGFPGESEADFEDTRKVMNICGFDMAYLSEFSPRKGTAASRLKDDVPNFIKAKRKKDLNDNALKPVSNEFNKALLGSAQLVLVEGIDRKTKDIQGRTAQNKVVRIKSVKDKELIGQFVKVKITDYSAWALEGEKTKD